MNYHLKDEEITTISQYGPMINCCPSKNRKFSHWMFFRIQLNNSNCLVFSKMLIVTEWSSDKEEHFVGIFFPKWDCSVIQCIYLLYAVGCRKMSYFKSITRMFFKCSLYFSVNALKSLILYSTSSVHWLPKYGCTVRSVHFVPVVGI